MIYESSGSKMLRKHSIKSILKRLCVISSFKGVYYILHTFPSPDEDYPQSAKFAVHIIVLIVVDFMQIRFSRSEIFLIRSTCFS